MKQIRLKIVFFITFFLMAIAASHAFATTIGGFASEAGAFIDYDSIEISFTGTGQTGSTRLESSAKISGLAGVTDSLDAYLYSATAYAWGETYINDSGMDYQDISAFTSVADPAGNDFARASGGFFGQYEAQTNGILTISMDYYLFINAQAGMEQSAFANASVFLNINGEEIFDSLAFTATNTSGYETETEWLNLSLSYDLAAGQFVDFSVLAVADASISNPVPEPGTFLLFGAGLIGFLGFRKKSNA